MRLRATPVRCAWITQGRGASYLLTDAALARAHLAEMRPVAIAALDASLPARANNIARMRDSKGRAHTHGTSYLLLKAISAGVTWHRGDGASIDISANTALAGAAAIAIEAGDGWQTDEPIWLVENQALFDRLDWMPPDAHGSIVYYGGQLSSLLLDWLAQRARSGQIMFFPDYDGVGLLNYARLREKSLAPVEFWLMPRLGGSAAQIWQQSGLAKYPQGVQCRRRTARRDRHAAASQSVVPGLVRARLGA